MRAFLSKFARKVGLIYDPFPAKKDINRAEVYFKPFDELRDLLVSWVEDARPEYATRQDFDPEMLGFDYLDEGGYGNVYTSPCRRFAIRVSKPGFDLGYQAFLGKALQRQDNPFYPKIYAVLHHNQRQVVLMECLQPIGLYNDDADKLVAKVRAACRFGGLVEVTDDFSQLTRDIQDAGREHMRHIDVDTRNAMIRPTGTRLQVVFTDPLS